MAKSVLNEDRFHNEEAAFEYVEAQLWPEGPVCPHCGKSARIGKLTGASTRINTYKCYHCRKPFTVKIGTIFEGSHVPMHKWLRAILLVRRTRHLNASQASSALGVSFKTAVAMITRIRSAARGPKIILFLCSTPALLAIYGQSPLSRHIPDLYMATWNGEAANNAGMHKETISFVRVDGEILKSNT